VNKSGLIDAVSKTTSLAKREAEEAVNALIHVVAGEVKSGRRVVVAGFGSFNPTRRGPRMGRNPQTGAPVAVSASRGVRFQASAMLKDVLNGRSPLPGSKKSAGRAGPARAGVTAGRTASRATKNAPGNVSRRAPAKKVAKRTLASTKKVVRRAPDKRAAKRAPARKAAKQSARKAVRRAPSRNSAKRVQARRAPKRSARRP